MHTQFWISEDVELVCSRGEFAYPLHTHISMLILNCVRSGIVTVHTSSETRHYRSGECFWLAPHVAHSLTRSIDSEVVSVCCTAKQVYVEGILYPHRMQNALADFQKYTLLSVQEVEKYKNVLSSMPCRLVEFAIDDAIRRLFAVLKTHPEEHTPLALLANQYNCSVWHTIRRFREATGLTPHQFLIQNRIRQAKRLLREKTSITDIALSTGFCDQSHLNRCLMRTVGLTPARYRAACHDVVCRLAQCREEFGKQA